MQKNIFLKVLVLVLGTQICLNAKNIIPHFTTSLDNNHSYQIGINWLWLKQKSPNHFLNKTNGQTSEDLTTKIRNGDYIDKNLLKRHITEIENEKLLLSSGYEIPHFLAKNRSGGNELKITNFNPVIIEKEISIKKPSYGDKDWNLEDMLPKTNSTNPFFDIPVASPVSVPDVKTPKQINDININLVGSGVVLYSDAYYLNTEMEDQYEKQSNFSQVTFEKGTFLKISPDFKNDYFANRNDGILKIKDYKVTKPLFYNEDNDEGELKDKPFEEGAGFKNIKNDMGHFLNAIRTAPYTKFKKDVKIYIDSQNYNPESNGDYDREYGFTVVMETYPNEDDFNYIINFDTADIDMINKKLANDEDKIDYNLPYFMPKDLEIGRQKDKSKVPLVYFENEGTVEIGKNAKGFLMTVVNAPSNKLYIANNKGNIVLLPRDDKKKKAAAFFYSPDIEQEPDTKEHIINVNTGDINLFGSHTMGFLATAFTNAYSPGSLKDSILSFINDGNLIVNGAKSIGIAIAGDKGDLGIGSSVHAFKPITLRGDETIGFYNENNTLNKENKSFNTMKIIIADKGNETEGYYSKIADENLEIKEDGEKGKEFEPQSNMTGNDERSVDNAIAIVYNANEHSSVMDLAKTDIQINANSTSGIGIYAKKGTIKLSGENSDAKIEDSFDNKIVNKIKENFKNSDNHIININGGKNNVALYSANDKSEIIYNGNINLNGGKDFEGKESTDNRAILATDNGKIEFQGKLNVGKDNSLITSSAVVYSDNAEVTIEGNSAISMNLADNSNGFYALNSLNPTNPNPQNSQPQIKIKEGAKIKLNGDGVGIVAGNGGYIDLSGATIEATGLKSALASIADGTNASYINAQNAVINYDGDSYATYSSQNNAKINLNNATIKLKGNSYGIALDYDKANNTYDVKGLMGKVKIEPLSDKVNIFTIKNYDDLQTSLFKNEDGALNLKDQNNIGSDFSYEIDRDNPDGKKATLALIDGLKNFLIDSNIDKSKAGQKGDKISDMKTDDEKIAFNFAKNIKIQRANITLDSGKTVKADMNKNELKNLSMSKPFAIAVSAGPNVTKKDETSITLKDNSKVIVDRKDQKEDAGVGLYIDFGKVNTNESSEIKVGSSNTENATGIYAVSSDVIHGGKIQTDSSLSIGAMLYAQNPEQPYSQTFIDHIGGASELNGFITNNGNIVVNGERSAGIYVDNNLNEDQNAYTATNKKNINVNAAKSIAMASSNSTLSNEGNINLNENSDSSIAMYGKDLQGESSSTLKNSGLISINSNHSAGMLNKSVDNDSSTQLLGGGEITSSKNTSKVTAISGKNIDVKNDSKIDLKGKNSVGIYADNSSNVNVEENAEISIGDDSIILYSKSNDGTIINYNIKNTEISGKNQTAIYLENSKENANTLILTSNSVFDVKGEDSKALHLKSIGNPSNYTFNDIAFNLQGKNNVAVLAENSTNVNLGANSKINMDELAYGSIGLALQGNNDETLTITNEGTINVAKSDKDNKIYSAAIALFSPGIAINNGTINTDDESVGMYGIDDENVNLQNENEININKNAVAMYIKNGAAKNSGKININGENGVGMYATKKGGSLINSGEILASSQGIGMFGNEYTKVSNLNKILLNNENSVGIYTKNEAVNKGNISLLGDSSIGIFAKNILNEGVIDLNSKGENDKFSAALVGDNIINTGTINLNKEYEVGMYGVGTSADRAILINDGAINLNENNQIGMYAKFADVKNSGDINVNAKNSIGIYADNSVIDNTGKITLNADNSVGVYMINGSYFKNRGEIKIIGNSKSVVKDDEEIDIALPGIASFRPNEVHKDKFKGVDIEVNKNTQNFEDFNVKYDNKIYNTQNSVKLSNSQIANNLDLSFLNKTTNIEIPKNLDNKSKEKRVKNNIVAMYADTSGAKLTKPIKGLDNLSKNDKIILYIGAEAANYTNERVINLDQSLMKPFIDELDKSTATKAVYSGSLTWQAFATFDKNAKNNHKIKSFVMSKIPYVNFIKKDSKYKDLYIALDKKYEKAIVGSNDKKIFNKLNLLGKNEEFKLHKDLKSLGGFEYASTQTRAYSSADIYDREFNDLMRWDTNTTDTTKFKIFGANTKRDQRVDGVLGYDKNAYGLFILNNFDLKMDGTSNGVFGGIAKERYEFKNDYKSKEDALTAQIGYYVDRKVLNEEVNHLLKIAATGSAREMKRYTLDKDFWAKSKYYTLGFDVKNSFYKEYKFDSGFKISPYAGVDLGYGIIDNIKEKSGNTLLLDVDSKDYYSIRPNLGIELGYTHLLDENSYFNILLDSKIYKEFGKINRANNLARFKDTNSYFSLPKEDKEDKGAEFTLVGKYENGNFGASLKGGYQTQFKDKFIGLDLRIKF